MMKVKLLQATNVRHEAGNIVEVSPARASFLMSCGAAVSLEENKETAMNPPIAETPEEPEVPEADVKIRKTTRKTTRK